MNLTVSAKKVSLQVGKSAILTTNQKVSWTSSDKKVAVVKKVSSKKVKIVAVKSGTCKVTVKNGKSKATVKVTVKKKQSDSTPTATPSATPVVVAVTPSVVTSSPKSDEGAAAEPQEPTVTAEPRVLTPEEQEELANATPIIGVRTPPPVDTGIYTGSAAGVTLTLVSNTVEVFDSL